MALPTTTERTRASSTKQNHSSTSYLKAAIMKCIDIVVRGSYVDGSRCSARHATYWQNVLLYLKKNISEGKKKFSRVRSVFEGYVKAAYCQNEMHCCRGPGASPYWPYRHWKWSVLVKKITGIISIQYKQSYLVDHFPEPARLAPPWSLRSSRLSTASVYYLLDLSSFSLLSLLFYCRVLVFSIRTCFFSSFVHKGSSSSSNTTTNRNTATTP